MTTTTTTLKTYASDGEKAAVDVGAAYTAAENDLFAAYALKEGTPQDQIDQAAKELGIKTTDDKGNAIPMTLRAIQLVCESRFQHASQIMSLFSGILDKVDQMKQRIISKFSN